MPPPPLSDCVLTLEGRVALLTLNRPDVRNELLSTGLAGEIAAVAEWINGEKRIGALVLTGAGSSFSAASQPRRLLDREQEVLGGGVAAMAAKYRHRVQRMARALAALEVPAIAAVNGLAAGPGFALACLCDLRLGSTEASLAEGSLALGLLPAAGSAWLLPRLLGWQRACELCFSARTLDAAEAQELGLLLEVVAPDDLLARAREIAAGFAARPPQALRLAKQLLRGGLHLGFAEHLEQAALAQAACYDSADHLEAVTALVEKRPPNFEGR
jgi:enoyl-CoA hydratase/carnithine racemase